MNIRWPGLQPIHAAELTCGRKACCNLKKIQHKNSSFNCFRGCLICLSDNNNVITLSSQSLLVPLQMFFCLVLARSHLFIFNCLIFAPQVYWACRTVWTCTVTSSEQGKPERAIPIARLNSALLNSPSWRPAWGASQSSVSTHASKMSVDVFLSKQEFY